MSNLSTKGGYQIGNRLLKRQDVESKTGLSRSSIYAAVKAGNFPEPISIGAHRVAWLEAEVDQWIISRISQRERKKLSSV